eukprot:GGOE01002439.1.p1 GENE.GGOE01002439.1~~GGOE01002439.1.p1  ORF type:complete len:614 (+),score=166.94 GGOE01002439.1:39-1844(+)
MPPAKAAAPPPLVAHARVLVEVFRFLGLVEHVLACRRVCRAWAKLLISDDVWEVTLRADHYMYLRWLAYEDEQLLARVNPMQPEPTRTKFQWYKWCKGQMVQERELQVHRKSLDQRGTMEDNLFAKALARQHPLSDAETQWQREQEQSAEGLLRSSVLAFADIQCLQPLFMNRRPLVGMGCSDGKVLLVDPIAAVSELSDPSVVPKFEAIDEHDSAVTCIVTTARYVFTCSSDCTVACFAADNLLRPLVVLVGHSEAVTCLTAHPADDGRVATGSLDRQVLLWDVLKSNKPSAVCRGHSMKVVSIETTADFVFTGARDASIHVWDWDGRRIRVLTGHVGPIVGLGSIRTAGLAGDFVYRIVSACTAGMVRVWNAASCRVLSSNSLVKSLTAVLVDRSLRAVVVGSFDGLTVAQDLHTQSKAHLVFHTRAVRQIQATDSLLFSMADDCCIAIWSLGGVGGLLSPSDSKPVPKKPAAPPTLKPHRVLQHTDFLSAMSISMLTATHRLTFVVTATINKRFHVWRSDSMSVTPDGSRDARAQLPEEVRPLSMAGEKGREGKAVSKAASPAITTPKGVKPGKPSEAATSVPSPKPVKEKAKAKKAP